MNTVRIFRTAIALVALTLGSAAALQAKIERAFSQSVNLEGISQVEIQLAAGEVTLVGSDRADLQFDLRQIFHTDSKSRADELEAALIRDIRREGDRLVIIVKGKNGGGFWKGLFGESERVSFAATIALPDDVEVKATTNGGNIDGRALRGGLKLQANGGNVGVRDAAGRVEAGANGGNVRVELSNGSAQLRSNGGNIDFQGDRAEVDARANGGNITAAFSEAPTGEVRLKTRGGNVKIRLPDSVGFTVDARAQGGSVRVKHSGTVEGESQPSKLNATVNGGGPLLDLSSAGGSVEIAGL